MFILCFNAIKVVIKRFEVRPSIIDRNREVADSFSLGSVDGKISVQIPISQGKLEKCNVNFPLVHLAKESDTPRSQFVFTFVVTITFWQGKMGKYTQTKRPSKQQRTQLVLV